MYITLVLEYQIKIKRLVLFYIFFTLFVFFFNVLHDTRKNLLYTGIYTELLVEIEIYVQSLGEKMH